MRDKNNEKYARSWSEIALSSDLARAYNGGLFHTMNLKFSYIQPGYNIRRTRRRTLWFNYGRRAQVESSCMGI